jgi:N-acetylglucosamine-6-phosphate deacetylase
MIAFTSSALYTPVEEIEEPLVLVENGTISRLSSRDELPTPSNAEIVDLGECTLSPGFIDIHVHGGAGHDIMQFDESGRRSFEKFLLEHGVTAYYPTTVAAPLDLTLTALEHMANAIEGAEVHGSGACPLGIHLEGPFLSHARRGVHPEKDLLVPSVKVFNKLWEASRGHVCVLTIAPELEHAAEVISEAVRHGVCVSLGHSDADLEAARAAIDAGAQHATHTFNAMRPLDHRRPGLLGEILTNPNLTADVIADGIHVAPAIVQLLLRAKGAENLVLITDAISATGRPDGRYLLGEIEVEVKNGRCESNGKLAGSTLTMDRAVRNLMEFANCDLQTSLRAASLNPARVAGGRKKGIIEPGADADMVVLTPAGEVRATITGGILIEHRQSRNPTKERHAG